MECSSSSTRQMQQNVLKISYHQHVINESWNKYLYYILSLRFKFRYEFRPNDVRLLTHYLLKTNRTLFCLLPSKEFLHLKQYWHSLKWMQVHFCFVQKSPKWMQSKYTFAMFNKSLDNRFSQKRVFQEDLRYFKCWNVS